MADNDNSNKMTKTKIIENIYEEFGIQRKDIHSIIDAFFSEVKEALKKDRVVELRGFGTFEIRTRKGREKARNPRTGEIVSMRTHGVPVFRPGKSLKTMARSLRE